MPLKVVTRPGTRILWLSGSVRGQRIRESAGTDNRALADEKRAAREASAFRAAIHGDRVSRPFAEAVLAYLKRPRSDDTRHRIGRVLAGLNRLGRRNVGCEQVDQNLLDRLCDVMLRPKAADSTRLREVISPVKSVLRHAAIRGWCSLPVFETVRQGRRRKEWLTPAEAEAIVSESPPHLKPLFEFMFCTGARRGEALGLDWKIRRARSLSGNLTGREVTCG